MAIKLNPTKISWTPTTAYEDGSAFGSADFAGYEFGYREIGATNWSLTVAVPVAFNITTLDLSALGLPQLKDLELAMRTVAKNGLSSAWSNSAQLRFDTRRPLAPSAVTVS